jgi:hypothetical protein
MNRVLHDTRLQTGPFEKHHPWRTINPPSPSGQERRASERLGLFDSFADMIQKVPDHSIIAVVERECLMLSRDMLWNAPWSKNDVGSILLFGEFIRRVRKTETISGGFFIPKKQYEIFQNLILKLIQARELAPDALQGYFNWFYQRST